MTMKRKVSKVGNNIMVAIPSQVAALHELKEGDYLEFTPIGTREFRIKKV